MDKSDGLPMSLGTAKVPGALPSQGEARAVWAEVVLQLERRLMELDEHLYKMDVMRRNAKNDLLTEMDEHVHLQMALVKERYKADQAWALLEEEGTEPQDVCPAHHDAVTPRLSAAIQEDAYLDDENSSLPPLLFSLSLNASDDDDLNGSDEIDLNDVD